jgi:hypothetical protein
MTDLNTLIPSASALYLVVAGGINDRGVITGQASDETTGDTPAFRALPTSGGETSPSQPGVSEPPRLALPENLRHMLLRRLGLDSAALRRAKAR